MEAREKRRSGESFGAGPLAEVPGLWTPKQDLAVLSLLRPAENGGSMEGTGGENYRWLDKDWGYLNDLQRLRLCHQIGRRVVL